MKEKSWNFKFGVTLVTISMILYALHIAIFKDAHHVAVFFLEDLAFIPIEVLVVTFIFEKVLSDREKAHTMEKLNMLIGVFFNELGSELLRLYSTGISSDIDFKEIETWDNRKFDSVAKEVRLANNIEIDVDKMELNDICSYLRGKRDFLISMLQNPALLENDTFTELLQAVFHLESELEYFNRNGDIVDEDKEHLKGDFERVYPLLKYEWLIYLKYMKRAYPYAFTMVIRNLKNDYR